MQPQSYPAPPSPMQPAPIKKKPSLHTITTWVIIAVTVVTLLCAIAWAVLHFMGYASSDNGKTQTGAAAVLEPETSAPMIRTIESQLGVAVQYDARELEAYGFADDVTYSSTDLTEPRAYTVIRLRPVATSEATRSNITLASPELRMTSSSSSNYWEVLSKKDGYAELSKLDMLVKETVDSRKTDQMVKASDVEATDIGGQQYRKVIFTSTDDRYGITTERREDCYISVQNDRPYVACINNIRPANFSVVPQLEKVLAATSYSAASESVLTTSDAVQTEDALVNDTADEDIETTDSQKEPAEKLSAKSKISDYLANSADFRALAGAAPATVRVGAVYCADIRLTLPNGSDGPTLTGACVDKAGSGFFISRDGLIATSASVVRVKPQEAIGSYITNAPTPAQVSQRLERVLAYMVEGRMLMQTDADALLAGVEERDQDVIAKINELSTQIEAENISVTKENYKYAIQLGDRPIVVSQSGNGESSFTYTDNVVEAKFEAATYSPTFTQSQLFNGESPAGDVALLKVAKQATYPVLNVERPGEGLAEGSVVNIVGRPMYAFGSLETAQLRSTPMYRSAKITETFTADEGQRLRAVATASHAGFAGAPVVNRAQAVVGLATYNNLNCPDQGCFAGTVVRDTSALSELVRKRNITLVSVSASSETWKRALEELTRGNYKNATALFKESSQLYPQNYLATQFAEYSEAQYGTAADTSTMNIITRILQTTIVISGILLILLAILKIALKILLKPRIETQYGNMGGGNYIDPSQWQQQPLQTLAPQTANVPPPTSWQPAQPQQQSYTPPQAPQQPTQYPPVSYPPYRQTQEETLPPETLPPRQS